MDEPAPGEARLNMGFDGGTAEASKSRTDAWLLAVSDNDDSKIWGTYDVRWGYGNIGTDETVRLEYSPDGGTTWGSIATDLAVNAVSYSWDVTTEQPSQIALWRILLESDTGIQDTCDSIFTVKNGPMEYYVNDASGVDDVYCTAIGNDVNTGRDPGDAKATPAGLLDAVQLDPGDTLYIDTGYYLLSSNAVLNYDDTGVAGTSVVVKGSSSGTTLDRGTDTVGTYCLGINGADYVKIENLLLTNGGSALFTRGDYSVYSNLTIRNARYGVEMFTGYSDYYGLDIRGCQDGISSGAGLGNAFSHCLVAWNSGDGVHMEGLSEGHWKSNSMRHCTIAYNGYKQIDISDYMLLDIRDSLVVASGSGNACFYQYWQQRMGGHGSVWANDGDFHGDYNVVYAENGATIGGRHTSGGGEGTYSNLVDWQTYSGQESNSLSAEPKFVDGQDFHLRSSAASGTYCMAMGGWTNYPGDDSPGIDVGDPSGDYSNEPQWNGCIVNVGAYGNTPYASRSGDTDGDTLSDSLEIYRLGTEANDLDSDDDGMGDGHEVVAGTDPNLSTSVFAATCTGGTMESGEELVITWPSTDGREYRVERANTPMTGFSPLASGIGATPPMNSWTTSVNGLEKAVYKVHVSR